MHLQLRGIGSRYYSSQIHVDLLCAHEVHFVSYYHDPKTTECAIFVFCEVKISGLLSLSGPLLILKSFYNKTPTVIRVLPEFG